MLSKSVISARGIGKRFALQSRPFDRLREVFVRSHVHKETDYWALRDVSFELRQGETLGVMGRNGCGKSTLLEIVAGTLQPTIGDVRVRGQLAALLELGAAFSPELTGRENVFVYGSLLGMSRATIVGCFDEIVDFAELRSYIDEPVKNYSSGMFIRLAFSTAVASTPEILVIDEALAVGDEAFQRRCFSRIESMKSSGVSILFVSHAAGTVMELCDRVLLLDRGQQLLLGTPNEVIRHYHRLIYAPYERQEEIRASILSGDEAETEAGENRPTPISDVRQASGGDALETEYYEPSLQSKSRLEYASRGAEILTPTIRDRDGNSINVLRRGGIYYICFRARFDEEAYGVRFGMLVKNVVGTELGGIVSQPAGNGIERVASGSELEVRLPFCARLVPDTYFANVGIVGFSDGGENHLHRITDAIAFRILRERSEIVTGTVDFSTGEPAQSESLSVSDASSVKPS